MTGVTLPDARSRCERLLPVIVEVARGANPVRQSLAHWMHAMRSVTSVASMDGNEAACELLISLAQAAELVTAANVHRLPTANIALALRYVETTLEMERLEQRAIGSCANLSEALAYRWAEDRIETARHCAVDALNVLREQVAVAPLTELAASLDSF